MSWGRSPRRLAVLILILMLLTQALPPGAAFAGDPPKGDPTPNPLTAEAVPDELIVGFKPTTSAAERDAAVSAQGSRTQSANDRFAFRVVRVPSGTARAAAIAGYLQDPAVRYAEPNYLYHASVEPTDPEYTNGSLWGLKNTGQTVGGQAGAAGADIDAVGAWATTTGSSTIVVGVVDSGVDYTHPDLASNMWTAPTGWGVKGCTAGTHGYRNDSAPIDCNPLDNNGHGTHVAGTIGAKGNNGFGVVGVNWDVQIMALRFLNAAGSGSTADAIDVLDYALQAKQQGINLRVLNNSWGGGPFSQALKDAIAALNTAGILFVAAAGNDNSNNDVAASYPSGYALPNIVAVAATDNRDQLASFSNYGATTVHLGAPGVDIYSTTGTTYGFKSGTSMATPHVAGTAALVLAAPGLATLTVSQLRQRLIECGDPIAALHGTTSTGRRLDAAKSIAGCAPAYTVALTPPTGGTTAVTPVQATYPAGTTITLTATGVGGPFGGWVLNGALATATNPLTLAVDSNLTVGALFQVNGANGDFPGATITLPTRQLTHTGAATTETNEPDPSCTGSATIGKTVWYSFTLPAAHTVTIATRGTGFNSGFDTVLAVHTGAAYTPPLSQVACDDDAAGGLRSRVTFAATAGTTYRVQVGGFNGASGALVTDFALSPAPASTLNAAAASGPYNGTTTLTATLAALGYSTPLGGKSVAFTLNGQAVGTAVTDAGGVATLANATLAPGGTAIPSGSYPSGAMSGVRATFAGESTLGASVATATLTVTQLTQTIAFGALADRTAGTAPFVVGATGGASGNPVTFVAASAAVCTAAGTNGTTITLVAAGTCTVTASQAGATNYSAAAPVGRSFTVAPAPPSPSSSPVTVALALIVVGGGTVGASPAAGAGGTYPVGTTVTLTPQPPVGGTLLGWTVDGVFQGWARPLTLTLGASRTVVATFAPLKGFGDATPAQTGATVAIGELAARGVIKGCDQAATPPLFCPTDPTLRAQMAVLIVRALGWGGEDPTNLFPDRNGVDDELWRSVAILAAHGVAKGYSDGTYGTTAPVLNAQVISFITRAMVDAGYWRFQPDSASIYPNVAANSGHRVDLATYVHYVGPVRGTGAITDDFGGWDQPSSRAYFAFALWQALDGYFGVSR